MGQRFPQEMVEVDGVLERVTVDGSPDALAAGDTGTVVVALQAGPAVAVLDTQSAELGPATMLSDQTQLFDQANVDVLVEAGTVSLTSFKESIVYELPLADLD